MNKTEFKSKVEDLIYQIENVISEMPYKGDSERQSQKIYLINQLNQFSYAVNGVEDEDFELEDDDTSIDEQVAQEEEQQAEQ